MRQAAGHRAAVPEKVVAPEPPPRAGARAAARARTAGEGQGQASRQAEGRERAKTTTTTPATGTATTTPAQPALTGDAARFADNHKMNITSGGVASRPPPAQGDIMKVIGNNRAGIKVCYQRALTRDNSLTHGKLSVKLSIGISGRVKHVGLDGPGAVPDPARAVHQGGRVALGVPAGVRRVRDRVPARVSGERIARGRPMRHPYADFLSDVEKPSRYVGGEYQEVRKDPARGRGARLPGVPRRLRHRDVPPRDQDPLLAPQQARRDIACERAFAPWLDMEAELRARGAAAASRSESARRCASSTSSASRCSTS